MGGGGGVNGTFSGGIVEEDVGVAGVGALPVGLTGPGGGGTFIGAAELCDPGRNAGSEVEIEVSFELEDPFLISANGRCNHNLCQCNNSIR